MPYEKYAFGRFSTGAAFSPVNDEVFEELTMKSYSWSSLSKKYLIPIDGATVVTPRDGPPRSCKLVI